MAVRAVHPPIAVGHDGELALALGRARTERRWRPVTLAWSALLGRLAAPVRTEESLAEFLAAPKGAQDAKKDVGGYVGGTLKEGRRTAASVAWRSCLTLDADFATDDLLRLDGFIRSVDAQSDVLDTHDMYLSVKRCMQKEEL